MSQEGVFTNEVKWCICFFIIWRTKMGAYAIFWQLEVRPHPNSYRPNSDKKK